MPPFNLIGMPQQMALTGVNPYTAPTSGPGFIPQQNASAPQQNVQGLIGQTLNNNANQNQSNFLQGDLKQMFGNTGQGSGLLGTVLGFLGA